MPYSAIDASRARLAQQQRQQVQQQVQRDHRRHVAEAAKQMNDLRVAWGSYYLSRELSLSLRERELVIDRTTARCGCEYEWGVHIAFYADRVALTPDQIRSLAHGTASDPCWVPRDALLLQAVDALHDTSTIDDELWNRLSAGFTEAQLLDLLMLTGWYHAISYAANAAQVQLEDWAPRFTDVIG